MKQPLKLNPTYKDYLWGGNKLAKYFNKDNNDNIIAESWELSIHPNGVSYVGDVRLDQYLSEHPDSLGYQKDHLGIMIKMIDAKQALSIQVHPDNEFALKNEGQNGKKETWLILAADEGAYIYYGLKQPLSRDELKTRLENNTILDVLNKVYVKPNDAFVVTPGTIHAICENVIILEVQQNSDVTYRLYDYERRDKNGNTRALHIDKAIRVCTLDKGQQAARPTLLCDNEHVKAELVDTNEYYAIRRYQVKDRFTLDITNRSFVYVVSVDGDNEMTYADTSIKMLKGTSYFIPAQDGTVTFGKPSTIIAVTQ